MKNLKNLGKALNKAEQKQVNGGVRRMCCEWAHAGGYWGSKVCIDWETPARTCSIAPDLGH